MPPVSEMKQKLLDGKVELRPMPDGSFDELILYDADDKRVTVHAEMMDGNRLWIGFYPPGTNGRVSMWISARGKLTINAFED